MKTVVHKLFWAWESEREEQWLNEMCANGKALVSVGFCRYEFEDCARKVIFLSDLFGDSI